MRFVVTYRDIHQHCQIGKAVLNKGPYKYIVIARPTKRCTGKGDEDLLGIACQEQRFLLDMRYGFDKF